MINDRDLFKNNFIDTYLTSIMKTSLNHNVILINEKSLNLCIIIFTKNSLSIDIAKPFLKQKVHTFIINTSTLIMKKNSKLSKMAFQKYFNVIYDHHSKNERIQKFYMNIKFLISLTSKKYRIIFFEKYRKYFMSNEKKLKCDDINENITHSRYYINPKIKMRIENEKKVIISKEIHLISNLSYDLIINTNILKSNNIVIQ